MEVSGGSKDQPVGRTLLVTDRLLRELNGPVMPASFCKLVRPLRERIDSPYLCFFLQHLYDTREINQFQVQSTGITNFQFETFLDGQFIELPPLPTQRKIAAILSAYGELIENHNGRIKLLDETAERIYREWFVSFRYPGHERVPLMGSEVGQIPEGWRTVPLSELATVVMGQSPPSSAYNRDGAGLPFHQGVGSYGPHFPVHEVYSTAGSRLAAEGDVLVSVRAPVGRINVADRELILGRGLAGVRAHLAPHEYLLNALLYFFREEDVMGNGAIFKAVTRRDMEGLPLLWPGEDLSEQFSDVVKPVWRELRILTAANSNARVTRDLLLPRLVSGEIDVTDMDIAIPEVAA